MSLNERWCCRCQMPIKVWCLGFDSRTLSKSCKRVKKNGTKRRKAINIIRNSSSNTSDETWCFIIKAPSEVLGIYCQLSKQKKSLFKEKHCNKVSLVDFWAREQSYVFENHMTSYWVSVIFGWCIDYKYLFLVWENKTIQSQLFLGHTLSLVVCDYLNAWCLCAPLKAIWFRI